MKTNRLNTDNCKLLICDRESEDQVDMLTWRMVKAQEIDGILDMDGDIANGKWNYNYAGLVSMKEYLQKPCTREQVEKLLDMVAGTLDEVEHYLIPEERVMLQTDSVYVDEDGYTYMVCLPIEGIRYPVRDFVREMAQEVTPAAGRTSHYLDTMKAFADIEGQEGRAALAELMRQLAQVEEEDIIPEPVPQPMPQMQPQGMPQQAASQMQPQGMPQPQAAPQMQPQGMPQQAVPQMQPQGMPQQAVPQMQPQGMPQTAPQMQPQRMPQGAPQVQQGMQQAVPQPMAQAQGVQQGTPETVVWNNMRGMIERCRTGETFILEKKEVRIGKDAVNSEVCITGNPTVSRHHAVIVNREDHYYLSDNHSTNHTYVNGKMLMPGEERELVRGDILRLSDEDFIFKIV